MRWYVNDASLQGQFLSIVEFLPALRELMDLRRSEPAYSSLFVARALGSRALLADQTLAHAVQSISDRDLRVRVLQWVNQRGPFFDDDRLTEEDDLFQCMGVDVTDQGLGEAARQIVHGLKAGTWSFVGGALNFCLNPLKVTHGLTEAPMGLYDVPNVWTADAFRVLAIEALPRPTSWSDLTIRLRMRFSRLNIPDAFHNNAKLQAEPFNTAISDRVEELCNHLNEYMKSRNANGSPSARTNEIIRALFTNAAGAEPLFTAESVSNQNSFRNELTFPDPSVPNRTIFAHWHGKIRHRFFRLHFEWPVPLDAAQLKVLYLGPKLTRD
jgi:hypothetical protein